jgi:uncharacterized protein (UPF0262 family)
VTDKPKRIVQVHFDEGSLGGRGAESEHERRVAVFDLLEGNDFGLVGHDGGPYALHLGIRENRIVLDVRMHDDTRLHEMRLSLTPFRSIIRDYFTVCDSYVEAIKNASPSRIEALDMGRRGLHNEGASLLRERLAHRIDMDIDTARRLFTLICALHAKV